MRKCRVRKQVLMELSSGYYVVGFFVGVEKRGAFHDLLIRSNDDPESFIERLAVRPYNQSTGEPTVDDNVIPGNLVAVRVWEEAVMFDRKTVNENGERIPTGERAAFVKRTALAVGNL